MESRSNIATIFRRLVIERLTEYMIKGFTMNDLVKELNYFLIMNRRGILKSSDKISYEDGVSLVRKEYDKYKDKIALKPSKGELHYLESIKNLEKLKIKKNISVCEKFLHVYF